MASTATTTLRMELMATGENDTTWGTKINTNFQIMESAVSGTTSVSTTGGDTTLTNVDYTNDQAKKAVLDITGTLVSNAQIVIPNAAKVYRVLNRTSGAYTVGIKTSSGSAILITQSTVAEVYCDGSNVIRYVTPLTDYTTGAPATSSGAAASSVSVTATGNLSSTNAQAALSELQTDIDTINSTLTSSYQPLDTDLTTIAGLANTKGNLIVGGGSSAWAALGVGTNGYAMIADSASSSGVKWAALIPAATVCLFYQAAAPTGWTISTSHTDHAIRCVGSSGGGAAGGTTAFTTVMAARTITQGNLPNVNFAGTAASDGAHTHSYTSEALSYSSAGQVAKVFESDLGGSSTAYTSSSNGAHTHTVTVASGGSGTAMDFAVAYISVIKASKDAY